MAAYVTYGTDRANAYKILEDTLNLKDARIYDTIEDAEGNKKRVLNKKETTLAQQKQQAIKDAFGTGSGVTRNAGRHWWQSIMNCSTAPVPANMTAATFILSA